MLSFLSSGIFWALLVMSVISYIFLRLVQKGEGNSKNLLEMIFGGIHFISLIISFFIVGWRGVLGILVIIVLISFPIEFLINYFYKRFFPEIYFMHKNR